MSPPFTVDWTVGRVMQLYPQTASVLIRFKTDCVGCPLERFCTLAEVAATYKLDLERLMDALWESASVPDPRSVST